jgi:tRNA (cmo5U34)-methyltransferase
MSSLRTERGQEREDWTDEAFVRDWLRRQEERAPERQRQFAMLCSLFPRSPDESFRYIDIAAGDGSLDRVLLERFPRAEATLLDGSPVMVKIAGEHFQQLGGRVTVARGDLESPDWRESIRGPFDVAVSSIALHNLEDPIRLRALYGEIYDSLSDGGFFMNLDYVRAPSHALWPLYQHATRDPEGGFSMGIRSIRDYAGSVDEQLGWLREAGFSPVDCFWREFRLAIFGGFKGTVRVGGQHG